MHLIFWNRRSSLPAPIITLPDFGLICTRVQQKARALAAHNTGPSMAMALFQSRWRQLQRATIAPVIGLDLAM
jgi:hypothetical protein